MTKMAADRPLTAAELVYLTQCHFARKEGGIAADVKLIDYAELPILRRRECELVAAVLFHRDVQRIMAEVMRAADWVDSFHHDDKHTAQVSMQKVTNWLLPPPAPAKTQEKAP
jgi:hypothetical protein